LTGRGSSGRSKAGADLDLRVVLVFVQDRLCGRQVDALQAGQLRPVVDGHSALARVAVGRPGADDVRSAPRLEDQGLVDGEGLVAAGDEADERRRGVPIPPPLGLGEVLLGGDPAPEGDAGDLHADCRAPERAPGRVGPGRDDGQVDRRPRAPSSCS